LAALFLLRSGSLYAVDNWQQIPQPIGELVTLWSANPAQGLPIPTSQLIPDISARGFSLPTTGVEEVNYICAQWDVNETPATVPWETSISVTEVTPTQTAHYVRFFYPGSSINGPWLTPSYEVRGKTPAQIQNDLALPMIPTSIVSVDIPASPDAVTGAQYAIWTGIASPIAGFGEGGGVQIRIMADFGTNYFPYTYDGLRYNTQPVGAIALSYAPLAGEGNSASIAHYLDQFVPAPYSDLESVYTSLDFLNWVGFTDSPLPKALTQLSPESYGALPFLAMRNSILFSDAILNRYLPLKQCQESCCSLGNDQSSCDTSLWIQGVIDSGKQQSDHHIGFEYMTYGTVVNVDFQPLSNMTIGVAGSWLATNIQWEKGGGGGHTNSGKAGVYASYVPSSFFIDTLVSGGYQWSSAHRRIDFPVATSLAVVTATGGRMFVSNEPINRNAHSHPNSEDLEAHVQSGWNFHRRCWTATPIARISYFYEKMLPFREHGAESLNLRVKGLDAHDLRTYLGVGAAYSIDRGCVSVVPQVSAMWTHDFSFNDRHVRAGLENLGGTFGVNYFHQAVNSVLASGGLRVLLPKQTALLAVYEFEWASHFVSQSGRLDFRVNF